MAMNLDLGASRTGRHVQHAAAGMPDHHGLQCGYCTPGILMTMTAFLNENTSPNEDEIRRGAFGKSVPVTGYQHIGRRRDRGGRQDAVSSDDHAIFRSAIKRNEDRRLLTGQALFIDDVELPDAACRLSPHPGRPMRGIKSMTFRQPASAPA